MRVSFSLHKRKQEAPPPAPVVLKPWDARTPAQLAYYLRSTAEKRFTVSLEDTTAAYVRGEIPVEELEMRIEMILQAGS